MTKLGFQFCHFSAVGLMIVPGQVQQSVQQKNS